MALPDAPPSKKRPLPPESDIAVIGLAVMGQNLILNMNDHGIKVTAFNRTTSKVDDFLAHEAKGTQIVGAHSIEEMMDSLKSPRRVLLLVKAGAAVDAFIEAILPHTEPGDIIIDAGNSLFSDTVRRTAHVEAAGRLYVGTGVSGGEEGARTGPSIMPGGSAAAWPHVKPILQAISAKAGEAEPCCQWVGSGGSGHYVKMVHNGIEYGDMQLIAEAYHLMGAGLGMDAAEQSAVFAEWDRGELCSYLIEITSAILAHKDSDGEPLVEKISDVAGQKGTGKWTGIEALEQGMPVTIIGEAVFARCLSALKAQRVIASAALAGPDEASLGSARAAVRADKVAFVESIRQALLASKIVSYAQGFMLLKEWAASQGVTLNFGEVALMWRGGCIIRSTFLGAIKQAYDEQPSLDNLLLAPYFVSLVGKCQAGWRKVVSHAAQLGVPTPAFSTALSFYDGYRTARLPANLLQAQRDYFGAHTFERLGAPGVWEHANWTGNTGRTVASTYNA